MRHPQPPKIKRNWAGIGDMEADKQKQGLSGVQVFTEGEETAGLLDGNILQAVCVGVSRG